MKCMLIALAIAYNLYGYLIYFCRENILMEVYWGQSVTKYVPFKEATLMYQNCYPYMVIKQLTKSWISNTPDILLVAR